MLLKTHKYQLCALHHNPVHLLKGLIHPMHTEVAWCKPSSDKPMVIRASFGVRQTHPSISVIDSEQQHNSLKAGLAPQQFVTKYVRNVSFWQMPKTSSRSLRVDHVGRQNVSRWLNIPLSVASPDVESNPNKSVTKSAFLPACFCPFCCCHRADCCWLMPTSILLSNNDSR